MFECSAPAGLSIREILGCDSERFGVTVDGVPIAPSSFSDTRPSAGALVVVVPMPGNDRMRSLLLTIGLIAAAAFAGPAIAKLAVMKGIFAKEAFWMGAIFAVGSLVQNALIKPGLIEPERQPRRLQSITGTRNEFRPFDVVPIIYGRHKVYPPYAALPFTEIVGDDQYFNALFALGHGEHDIEDAKIGETLLTNYQGVQLIKTFAPAWPNIIENDVAATLEDPNAPGTPTSSQIATTAAAVEMASVDFMCPGGLIYINTKGERRTVKIDFLVEFRTAGSGGAWTNVRTLVGTDPGYLGWDPTWIEWTYGFNNVGGLDGLDHNSYVGPVIASPRNSTDFRVTGRTRDGIRFGIKWQFPSSGQYEVRVTRTYMEQDTVYPGGGDPAIELEKFAQVFIWTVLRSQDTDLAAVNTGGDIECLQLRIKADDLVHGILDQFNVVAQRKVRIWDSGSQTFTSEQPTRNPAWAYLDILTGIANPRPVTDPTLRIWLDELAFWASHCEAEQRKFDRVFDQETTVFDALGVCAAAGRAGRSLRDAKHTVIMEESGTVPSQVFTPRNSRGFSFEHRFVDMPHALKCRFLSEDQDWKQDEILVYDDGYEAGNATKFETITLDGKTDPDEVWKFGRYHLAQARLRPAIYTFEADVEHLASVRGDLIHVEHDVVLWNLGRGRIVSIWGNVITLDESFSITAGTQYVVKIRAVASDGSISVEDYPVTAPVGTTVRTFTITAALTSNVRVGDLAVLGVAQQEDIALKIVSIRPMPGLKAEIIAVDAAPEILDADTGTIPPYNPNITAPVDPQDVIPPAPEIVSISSAPNLAVVMPSGQRAARISIAYRIPSFQGTLYDTVEARIRVKQTTNEQPWMLLPAQGVRGGSVASFDVEPTETYEVQLRVLTVYGTPSDWSTMSEHTVADFSLVLEAPTGFTVTPIEGAVRITLDVAALDAREVGAIEVIHHTENNRDALGATSRKFASPADLDIMTFFFFDIPLPAGQPLWFWIRFISIYGVGGLWTPSDATDGVAARPQREVGSLADELCRDPNITNGAVWTDIFETSGTHEGQGNAVQFTEGAGEDGGGAFILTAADERVGTVCRTGDEIDTEVRVGDMIALEGRIKWNAAFSDGFVTVLRIHNGDGTGTPALVDVVLMGSGDPPTADDTWTTVNGFWRINTTLPSGGPPYRIRCGCRRGTAGGGSLWVTRLSFRRVVETTTLLDLPVYADEAAAAAGGLASSRIYQTSAGALRIKL